MTVAVALTANALNQVPGVVDMDAVMTQMTSTNGFTFANTGQEYVVVNNGATNGIVTLTMTGVGYCSEAILHNLAAFAVAQGKIGIFGPFSTAHFNGTTGLATCAIDKFDSGIKVGVFRSGATVG